MREESMANGTDGARTLEDECSGGAAVAPAPEESEAGPRESLALEASDSSGIPEPGEPYERGGYHCIDVVVGAGIEGDIGDDKFDFDDIRILVGLAHTYNHGTEMKLSTYGRTTDVKNARQMAEVKLSYGDRVTIMTGGKEAEEAAQGIYDFLNCPDTSHKHDPEEAKEWLRHMDMHRDGEWLYVDIELEKRGLRGDFTKTSKLVGIAQEYKSLDISLRRGDSEESADCKSGMSVWKFNAEKGDNLRIMVRGPNAADEVKALEQLYVYMKSGFDDRYEAKTL
jgi:phosphotransferase system HPr-like phosphotransfer protein